MLSSDNDQPQGPMPPEATSVDPKLSRIEKDQTDTSGMFWRYIARKAATNPSGTVLPGMSCSAIDQGNMSTTGRRRGRITYSANSSSSVRSDLACQCTKFEDGAFTRVAASPT